MLLTVATKLCVLHSCVNAHVGYFHVLATVSNAAMNIGVLICVSGTDFIFFGYISGAYGGSILNFLRNLHTVFYNSYTNLYFHHQCTRVGKPQPLVWKMPLLQDHLPYLKMFSLRWHSNVMTREPNVLPCPWAYWQPGFRLCVVYAWLVSDHVQGMSMPFSPWCSVPGWFVSSLS